MARRAVAGKEKSCFKALADQGTRDHHQVIDASRTPHLHRGVVIIVPAREEVRQIDHRQAVRLLGQRQGYRLRKIPRSRWHGAVHIP